MNNFYLITKLSNHRFKIILIDLHSDFYFILHKLINMISNSSKSCVPCLFQQVSCTYIEVISNHHLKNYFIIKPIFQCMLIAFMNKSQLFLTIYISCLRFDFWHIFYLIIRQKILLLLIFYKNRDYFLSPKSYRVSCIPCSSSSSYIIITYSNSSLSNYIKKVLQFWFSLYRRSWCYQKIR